MELFGRVRKIVKIKGYLLDAAVIRIVCIGILVVEPE